MDVLANLAKNEAGKFVPVEQPRQNGVLRPVSGTKTGLVWDFADALYEARKNAGAENPVPLVGEVMQLYNQVADSVPSTCRHQFGFWLKYHDRTDLSKARIAAEGDHEDEEKRKAREAKEAAKLAKIAERQAKAEARVKAMTDKAEEMVKKANEAKAKAEERAKAAQAKAEEALKKAQERAAQAAARAAGAATTEAATTATTAPETAPEAPADATAAATDEAPAAGRKGRAA